MALLAVSAAAQEDSAAFPADEEFEPVVVLSPQPNSAVSGDEPLEVTVLLAGTSDMVIKLYLDSIDVTPGAEASGEYLFYLSPAPLPAGPHALVVFGLAQQDTVLARRWSFTVLPAEAVTEPRVLFWEASVGLGWQYADCSRDTAGLGLSYPVGHHPSAEASLSGDLWGGYVNSFLSYDPSYDRNPHGMAQLAREGLELSLGEFCPEFSDLTFSGATPLGLYGRFNSGRMSLDLVACRTASADTAYSTFDQYLSGGQVRCLIWDSLSAAVGYLQGYDYASSLPDSVRYRTTSLVYADTVFGFSDTMITVDTLHPFRNKLVWVGASVPVKFASLRLELVRAGTTADTGGLTIGWGYAAGLSFRSRRHLLALSYSSTDAAFRSFGNPYLEIAKNELAMALETRWPRNLTVAVDGGVYKVFTDSVPGNSGRAGIGLSWCSGWLKSLALRMDYSSRPYQNYRAHGRSLSASAVVSLWMARLGPSYSYTSSSTDKTVQSHAAGLEISRPLYQQLLVLALGHQYYQIRDNANSSNQEKNTSYFRASGVLGFNLSYEIAARRIALADRIESAGSYHQNVLCPSPADFRNQKTGELL